MDSTLFENELRALAEMNDNFRLDIALSLQQQNKQGGPCYVQVVLCALFEGIS